jgi:hypothetical protein
MKVRAFVGLTIVIFLLSALAPADAITYCWDYVYYRFLAYGSRSTEDPNSQNVKNDTNKFTRKQLEHLLTGNNYWPLTPAPPGNQLKKGDVIFMPAKGTTGHVGFVNGPDNIDSFIIVEGTGVKTGSYPALPAPPPTHDEVATNGLPNGVAPPRPVGSFRGGVYKGDSLAAFLNVHYDPNAPKPNWVGHGDYAVYRKRLCHGFQGHWKTNWDQMTISGTSGTYVYQGGHLSGAVSGIWRGDATVYDVFSGTWSQTGNGRTGWFKFTLAPNGDAFTGEWGYTGGPRVGDWSATCIGPLALQG